MRKFSCRCGSISFSVAEDNAGRLNCAKCGDHYYWNGKCFVPATRLNTVLYLIQRIMGKEKPLEEVPVQEFQEIEYADTAALDKLILEERKKAKELKEIIHEKKTLVLEEPKKRELCWSKTWHDFIFDIVEAGLVAVVSDQHVGKFRGKHIIKEAHRRFNLLGLKSTIDFNKGTIQLMDDKEKARMALKEIRVWQ